MTDREVLPGCARVRIKCAEKTSVGLWGQSRDPRELPGVTGPARGWVGVLHYYTELSYVSISSPDTVLWTYAAQLSLLEDEMRRMERVNVRYFFTNLCDHTIFLRTL